MKVIFDCGPGGLPGTPALPASYGSPGCRYQAGPGRRKDAGPGRPPDRGPARRQGVLP